MKQFFSDFLKGLKFFFTMSKAEMRKMDAFDWVVLVMAFIALVSSILSFFIVYIVATKY